MQYCRGWWWCCVCTTGKSIKEISMNSNCMFIDGCLFANSACNAHSSSPDIQVAGLFQATMFIENDYFEALHTRIWGNLKFTFTNIISHHIWQIRTEESGLTTIDGQQTAVGFSRDLLTSVKMRSLSCICSQILWKKPNISKHWLVRNYLYQSSFLTRGQNWKLSFLLYHPIRAMRYSSDRTKVKIKKNFHMDISYQWKCCTSKQLWGTGNK